MSQHTFPRSPPTLKVKTGQLRYKIPLHSSFKQNQIADFDCCRSDVKQKIMLFFKAFYCWHELPAQLLLRQTELTEACWDPPPPNNVVKSVIYRLLSLYPWWPKSITSATVLLLSLRSWNVLLCENRTKCNLVEIMYLRQCLLYFYEHMHGTSFLSCSIFNVSVLQAVFIPNSGILPHFTTNPTIRQVK